MNISRRRNREEYSKIEFINQIEMNWIIRKNSPPKLFAPKFHRDMTNSLHQILICRFVDNYPRAYVYIARIVPTSRLIAEYEVFMNFFH